MKKAKPKPRRVEDAIMDIAMDVFAARDYADSAVEKLKRLHLALIAGDMVRRKKIKPKS